MNTPTKQQWQTVIDNIKKVLPLAILENHLNMMETSVNVDHMCGTIHCFAGWYAVAVLDTTTPLNYGMGGDKVAADLGFVDMFAIEDWAASHPQIWGNEMGGGMFSSRGAFGLKSENGGLPDIILHLEGVRDRTP